MEIFELVPLSTDERDFNYWLYYLGQIGGKEFRGSIFEIKDQMSGYNDRYHFYSKHLYCDTCMTIVLPISAPMHRGHTFIYERPRYI